MPKTKKKTKMTEIRKIIRNSKEVKEPGMKEKTKKPENDKKYPKCKKSKISEDNKQS